MLSSGSTHSSESSFIVEPRLFARRLASDVSIHKVLEYAMVTLKVVGIPSWIADILIAQSELTSIKIVDMDALVLPYAYKFGGEAGQREMKEVVEKLWKNLKWGQRKLYEKEFGYAESMQYASTFLSESKLVISGTVRAWWNALAARPTDEGDVGFTINEIAKKLQIAIPMVFDDYVKK